MIRSARRCLCDRVYGEESTAVLLANQPVLDLGPTVLALGLVSATAILMASIARKAIARKSQTRFETLAEAIPQIIWIAESTGKTT